MSSEVDLSASGFALGDKNYINGNSYIDSVFDVQSQTAAVTLVRASGFVSVPEPSAFATLLLGAGMFGMGLRLRRRS